MGCKVFLAILPKSDPESKTLLRLGRRTVAISYKPIAREGPDIWGKGSIYLKTPDGASERQNGTQKFTDLTEIEARLSSKSTVKGRFKGNIEVMGYSGGPSIDGIVHSKISGTIKGSPINENVKKGDSRLSTAVPSTLYY